MPTTASLDPERLDWRPLHRRIAPARDPNTGVKLASRAPHRNGVGSVTVTLAADALAALKIKPGSRVVILITEYQGGHIIWLRRAHAGESNTRAMPAVGKGRRSAVIEFHLAGSVTPPIPPRQTRFEAHPAAGGGLLIYPDKELGAAFAAIESPGGLERAA